MINFFNLSESHPIPGLTKIFLFMLYAVHLSATPNGAKFDDNYFP